MPPAPAAAARSRAGLAGARLFTLLALALALLVLGSYRFGHHAAWHLDDFPNIVQRPSVQMHNLAPDALLQAAREGDLAQRPLTNVTFAIDWWRSGAPAGAGPSATAALPRTFIATNLFIHGLAAILVLALAWLACGRPWPAFAAAAWWAVQPVHMTAVAYASQRFTSLAALLILAAVTAWVAARRPEVGPRRKFLMAVAAGCAALAPFAKETGLLALPLLLLAEFTLCRPAGPLYRGPRDGFLLGAACLATLALALDLLLHGPARTYLDAIFAARYQFGMGEQLLTQARVFFFYLSLVAWPDPARFSLLHDFPMSRGLLAPATSLVAWLAIAAWIALALRCLGQGRRILAFTMLWVPVAASMENSILPIEPVYEYRLYLPSVGLAVLIAWAAARVPAGPRRHAVLAAVLLWSAAAATVTWGRAPLYGSSAAIADEMYRHAPSNPLAALAVGTMDLEQGKPAAAERVFRALAEQPVLGGEPRHRHEAFNGLGEALFAQGRYPEAAASYTRAITLAPEISIYRWNMALALEKTGECRQAYGHWQAFLQLSRDSGDKQEVEAHLREVHGPRGACAGGRLP